MSFVSASRSSTSWSPEKRDVAMVFQNYALYPHMSIFENIAFPLRSRRLPKAEIRERVERAANLLGLGDMLKRRPRTLSGGQRQRVAMGRAIVREPQVFLMDEPLSNLDAKLRVQMRAEISKLQQDLGVTTIYVTHDQVEAMTMGTRIAVMRKGVLQQTGPAQQLYDEPANLFVATFIGSPAMTLFRVRVERREDMIHVVLGDQELALSAQASTLYSALASYDGAEVALGVRPEDMRELSADNSANPRIRGEVRLVEALGAERRQPSVRALVGRDPAELRHAAVRIADGSSSTRAPTEPEVRSGIFRGQVARAGVELLHEGVRPGSTAVTRAGRECGERHLEPVALRARVAEEHQRAADRVDREVDVAVVVVVGRSETAAVDLGPASRARPPLAAANRPGACAVRFSKA